jgi:dUTP pyrophosphatase
MVIRPEVRVEVEEVSSLSPTSRVTGGFGSTGIAANV